MNAAPGPVALRAALLAVGLGAALTAAWRVAGRRLFRWNGTTRHIEPVAANEDGSATQKGTPR